MSRQRLTAVLTRAALMRATLVLCLCKLGLVTRTSRIRSKVDHAPLSPCLFSPAHASLGGGTVIHRWFS